MTNNPPDPKEGAFTMAKAKSKSQKIRDMIAVHPEAKSPEIANLLAEKGTKVSKNLVYLVRAKTKAKKRKIKRQKALAVSTNAGIANPVELIRGIKALAEKAGGLRILKQMVDVLVE